MAKRRPKIITAKWLVKQHACIEACEGFAKHFPAGLAVTRANFHKVARFNWCTLWYFADIYLNKRERAIYERNGYDPWQDGDREIKVCLLKALGFQS